uniref:Chromosome 16 open reading frame 86 n=1 Tax=Balaenoptera musculus TaxID=9771 RepID=A0A8C0DZ83_BALMU
MASAGAEKRPGAQEGTALGQSQLTEVPGDQCLVPAHEACQTQGEDKCPTGPVSEPKIQEERLKLEEERHKPEVQALEERGPRPMASIVRTSHGLKRKAEAELPQGMLLQREERESSQSEPSPSAKQHKKAKKRKSVGTPVLPVVASTVSAPSETLGLEPPALPRVLAGKAQRLRPLYQYINYCNPELNQAGEGDREAEAEVKPESELALIPEETGVEQLQALLPTAGELGSGLTLPCPNMFMTPTYTLVPLGEEAGKEPGGLPSLGVSDCLKAEMDKSTQVDINKMLSVCAAPLVPPLSPQYK